MNTFQQFISKLNGFWEKQGCIIHQGYDLEVGAGTFNPATFLRCLGPEPYCAAYVEPCRRPSDGRYGTNPNRLQHYFQYQVILKPSPENIQELYLQSLEALGFNLNEHDIRFVHDDWENPTIGAWGLGWEVWMDGMEITQFTYFQSVGGVDLKPITGEITYGIERLAMYLQRVDTIFDLQWSKDFTYGDIYHRNEVEWSHYNFEAASTEMWQKHFEDYENEAKKLIAAELPIPAYDFVMKASHAFNLLDARGVISVTERTGYIGHIRDLAKQIAESYMTSRAKQGHPLLKRMKTPPPPLLPNSPIVLSKYLENPSKEAKEDFLLEIGSEELPASFVTIGINHLEKKIQDLLEKEEINYERISCYATPRRLAIIIHQLALYKPEKKSEKKGPSVEQAFTADGQLKPAAIGFFRALNYAPVSLDSIRQGNAPHIEIRRVKETDYLFGVLHQPGKATALVLQEQLPQLILNLDFPKTMRWGTVDITYARPLRWIVSLFGEEVIPLSVGPLHSGQTSFGHRQLAPGPIFIKKVSEYIQNMKTHYVMPDLEERRQSIHTQLDSLEKEYLVSIIARDRVIPQVLNLVEWPFLTAASFRSEFLKAPQEVLISEMVEHQKYFPVIQSDGSLKNLFIITANIPPTEQIKEGNQKVLSARLSDGVFLYEEDLRIPLATFNEKLKKVTFQKELGTVFQKVERLVQHAKAIQNKLQISTPEKVVQASLLSKADLASNMVYEFPELQGTMGTYYALAQKEDPEVAKAIEEQWMPRGENAPLPQTETGSILSLADKFDNLLGCFSVGLKPTSSSDPYSLRRQVLGIIKILIHHQYELPLQSTLLACADHFPAKLMNNKQMIAEEIHLFILNRIKSVFLEYGFFKDEIEASLANGCRDIYDTFCRVKALHHFRIEAKEQFYSLCEVYKRAKGQIEGQQTATINPKYFVEPIEEHLNSLLNAQTAAFQSAILKRNYKDAYQLIATLQQPLGQLFEQVKILAEDPMIRNNRLALLQRVFNLFEEILDFSKISD